MLNRELSLTFTSESDIIKLQRYELYDNRYRIFGNIASFIREVLFIVDFKENIKRIWGTTTKKKIVISAAALAVVAAGGITTGVVVNHQKDSNQSISVDAHQRAQPRQPQQPRQRPPQHRHPLPRRQCPQPRSRRKTQITAIMMTVVL